MKICKEGYLNSFVKPVSEGGWGLCEWIVSVMTENRGYSNQEIYALIQDSNLDGSIKALSEYNVKSICEWMLGNEISNFVIANAETDEITYIKPE